MHASTIKTWIVKRLFAIHDQSHLHVQKYYASATATLCDHSQRCVTTQIIAISDLKQFNSDF